MFTKLRYSEILLRSPNNAKIQPPTTMATDEYEEYEFIDDIIWDKALNEPYKYAVEFVA